MLLVVISGELNPNILSVLENTISSVFAPMLKKQDKWGKIDADQEKETFIKDLDTFTTDIKRSLKNLKGVCFMRTHMCVCVCVC